MSKIIRPIIPTPPSEYDRDYVMQLARSIEDIINKLETPLTNVPNIADVADLSSLQVGDLYKDASGFVKIKTS